MIGMYLLVSLLTQFVPAYSLDLAYIADFSITSKSTSSSSSEFTILLDELNGAAVGSSVYVAGSVAGTISSIVASDDNTGKESWTVGLKIENQYKGLLKEGTIAFVVSTNSTISNNPETVVELFVPSKGKTQLSEGANIVGFTSYEKFWLSNS